MANLQTLIELIVTSFSTRGTPLIRYRTGDFVTLSRDFLAHVDLIFPSLNRYRDVLQILLFHQTLFCNLGNLSNCTKGVEGIVKFQVIQTSIDFITVLLVVSDYFNDFNRNKFVSSLKERLGSSIKIHLDFI